LSSVANLLLLDEFPQQVQLSSVANLLLLDEFMKLRPLPVRHRLVSQTNSTGELGKFVGYTIQVFSSPALLQANNLRFVGEFKFLKVPQNFKTQIENLPAGRLSDP
jgi:hypothetical protein